MKAGFVAVVGRPNVGKSTLVNALAGTKVSIVSPKPQTTRDAIQAVVTRPEGQIVFVDSPGIHQPKMELGRRMLREIRRASDGCHVVLFLIDVSRGMGPKDEQALATLPQSDTPVVLVLNKVDRLSAKEELLPLIEQCSKLHDFAAYVPISARKEDGLDRLLVEIFERLPEADNYYPDDYITDQPERFLASELIRERILHETEQEVPHHTHVAIEKWEEKGNLLRLAAVVYVERDGQKGIIIGKGGEMLKRIASSARASLEAAFARKIYMQVFVKVKPGWRDKPAFMKTLDDGRYLTGIGGLEPDLELEPEGVEKLDLQALGLDGGLDGDDPVA